MSKWNISHEILSKIQNGLYIFSTPQKTHLCWIWLSLVQPSVQASRTGWDGNSPPRPPLSQRHSGSRHKSLQRWCRHLEPQESINPVDEAEKAKTGELFLLCFSPFFSLQGSNINKALLEYGDRMLELLKLVENLRMTRHKADRKVAFIIFNQ